MSEAEGAQLYLVIEVVVGVMVAAMFILIATNVDFSSNGFKLYAQQDITLMAESLDAAPGTVIYEYQLKNSYTVSIGEKVTVSRSDAPLTGTFSKQTLTFEKTPDSRTIKVKHG